MNTTQYMSALLNDFATRSFRDVADYDYIHARLAYRFRLLPQFHWSALQAIEKYLKAILLYNRIVARDLRHNLAKAIERVKLAPFAIRLSPITTQLIEHLDTFARFRYLESSYYVHGPKLAELDKAVWEIRRYCRVINHELEVDGKKVDMLPYELVAIEQSEARKPQEFRTVGGELEKIIDDPKHAARAALVWQNICFCKSHRKTVRLHLHFQATNAPLTLHPELLDDVIKYVYLPKEVEKAYRAELTNPGRVR
jgi:hypothetical protein